MSPRSSARPAALAVSHDEASVTRIAERYAVIEQLGRGGMAVVYRVRDLGQGRELALKQLMLHNPERDRAARAQFEREFYLLAQLSHPSVIQVYDYGVEAQQPYYTMELLDGGDLSARAPMDVRSACELMVQLCSSLSLLHSRRLVHRDVSPRNVRCTLDGSAKLIDFGALLPMGPCQQSVGTPGFVAPEVVHHLPIDARTDLFSLGATLYFALTGKKPFAARTFAELNEVWREPPVPPAQLTPAIPAALNALVLALLQIDPARRPQSAFDVMQRLAAIAGLVQAEPERIAQSYLATPALIGREAEQRRFRHQLRRALAAHGGGMFFVGEAGSGRSRLLEVSAIEAKLAGATVISVSGRSSTGAAFATAQQLVDQLLLQLPVLADTCARGAGSASLLLDNSSPARANSLEVFGRDRPRTQTDLCAWLRAVAALRPLVIAIDDAERVDDASLACLVALAREISDCRILLVAGVLSSAIVPAHPVLDILRSHVTVVELLALSSEQTEALFASIFFDAPHVALVSHRVHRLAAGNLRESMALAQDLLDRRVIRYVDGAWSLPAVLAVSTLPSSAEDALQARVAALPALARELATTQALDLEFPFRVADYAVLAPTVAVPAIEEALAVLVRHGVVVQSADSYTLSHLGMRAVLVANLAAVERARRHAELVALCAISGRATLVAVHHGLLAGQVEQALDRLMALLAAEPSLLALQDSRIDHRMIGAIIERARECSIAARRPTREAYELSQRLMEVSVATDDALYMRIAPFWLARLEQDSGLLDYRQLDATLPALERLKIAVEATIARYEATPERERVYQAFDAIKLLAHFVSISLAIAVRTRDRRLLATLPSRLEPFASVSPLIDALLQTTLATDEMNGDAQFERARERLLRAYAQLEAVGGDNPIYHAILSHAVAGAISVIDTTLGLPSAEHWIGIAQGDALHRLGAVNLQRAVCLFDGDLAAAERYRNEAELLAIQTDGRVVFSLRLTLMLAAHAHAGDLAGVRYVADRIEQLAQSAPGWISMHAVAQGTYESMRGDFEAARVAYARALQSADPKQVDPQPDLDAWVSAAAGYVNVLIELGRPAEALAFGSDAHAISEALELSGGAPLVRALALAQARTGDVAGAARRLERSIAQRAQLRPSMRVPDYLARTRIALWQRDATVAAQFMKLALEHGATMAVRSRVLDEAKQVGLAIDSDLSVVEAALAKVEAANGDQWRQRVQARFAGLASAQARAERTLELFVEAVAVDAGYLYYLKGDKLVCVARLKRAQDSAVDQFAAGYFQHDREREAMTTIFTDMDDAQPSSLATFTGRDGSKYGVTVFGSDADCAVGVVMLAGAHDVARVKTLPALSKAIGRYLIELGDIESV